jgi:uncharacterized protein (UPF0332 family)
MSLHADLLTLARDSVDRNPGAQIEAELRRSVSSAYYAVFHLLIHEATTRLVAIAALRARVARSFDHKVMNKVCQEYGSSTPNNTGQYVTSTGYVIPSQIREIARAFVTLQEFRHRADYNTAVTVAHGEADTEVTRAEVAFLDWAAVQADPAADTFLAELLCRGIPRR